MQNDVQELTRQVVDWADWAFPERTPTSALIKLYEEIGELSRDLRSPGEYADVFIMVLDLAHMHGVDVARAIRDKIEINRRRTWSRTTLGTYQHD